MTGPFTCGADGNDVLLHRGIVGRNAAAAGKPVIGAAEQKDRRHDQHQDGAQPARCPLGVFDRLAASGGGLSSTSVGCR